MRASTFQAGKKFPRIVTVCDRPVTKSDIILICDELFRHKFRKFGHNFGSVHVHLSIRHNEEHFVAIFVTNCDG